MARIWLDEQTLTGQRRRMERTDALVTRYRKSSNKPPGGLLFQPHSTRGLFGGLTVVNNRELSISRREH